MGCCSSKSTKRPAAQLPPSIPLEPVDHVFAQFALGGDYLSEEDGGNIAQFFALLNCSLERAEGFAAFYVLNLSNFSKMTRVELMDFCRK